ALLLAYLVFRLFGGILPSTPLRRRWPAAVGLFALVLVALPVVNLAYLLPRLAYLPHTTLGLGYQKLDALAGQLSGGPQPLPRLAGVGVHAWTRASGGQQRTAMIAPALLVWGVANALSGRPYVFPPLSLVGSLPAVAVLMVTAWRSSLAWLIPALVFVELAA